MTVTTESIGVGVAGLGKQYRIGARLRKSASVADAAQVGLEDDAALRGSRDGYLRLIGADESIVGSAGYRLTAIRQDQESRGRSRRPVWPPPVDPAADGRNVRHSIRLHAHAGYGFEG